MGLKNFAQRTFLALTFRSPQFNSGGVPPVAPAPSSIGTRRQIGGYAAQVAFTSPQGIDVYDVGDLERQAVRVVTVGALDGANDVIVFGGTVSGTALQVATSAALRTVTIKACNGNGTGVVYVGNSSAVTADEGNATSGYPLLKNESVTLQINASDLLWVIGSTSNMRYAVVCV